MFFLLCKFNDSNCVTTLSAALLVSVLFCTYFLKLFLACSVHFSFIASFLVQVMIAHHDHHLHWTDSVLQWTYSLKLFPYIFPSLHIFFIQTETLQSNVVSGHPSFLCLIIVAIITFWPHILQKLEVTKKLQNARTLYIKIEQKKGKKKEKKSFCHWSLDNPLVPFSCSHHKSCQKLTRFCGFCNFYGGSCIAISLW